jgi:ribosome-binding protein aMBF1 (putative translation factor)
MGDWENCDCCGEELSGEWESIEYCGKLLTLCLHCYWDYWERVVR